MSLSLKPLMWKVYEKVESDEIWPKKLCGTSLIYLEESNQYLLIGGNFNSYENANKNVELNRQIISGTMESFNQLEKAKRVYLTDTVTAASKSGKNIEVYFYQLTPERKWYKAPSYGRVPRARSFHRCLEMSKYYTNLNKIYILPISFI